MDAKQQYDLMVKRGKELVKQIEGYQQEIAKMAIAVCDIRHGGRSTNLYTMKDYAEDIGVAPKTLQNWVSVYRNVIVKLDKKIQGKKSWGHARLTNDLLKEKRKNVNADAGKPGTRHAFKKEVPPDEVREIFNEVEKSNGGMVQQFINMIQYSKRIKYCLENGDLNKIDDRELLGLMETLDEASELINEHLTKKQAVA